MKYLLETHLHHMGETDSQAVILCEACLANWPRKHDDNVTAADSDIACEQCGSVTALDCAQDLLGQISNRLEHETKLSSTERRALYARGVQLDSAIKRGETACELLLKGK